MKLSRENLFIFFTFIVMLADRSWFFKSSASLLKVGVAIKLLLPIVMLFFFKKRKPNKEAVLCLCLYGLLFIYFIILSFFHSFLNFILTIKVMYNLTWLVTLMFIMRPCFLGEKVLKIPCYLGFIFSIQSICLFVLLNVGIKLPHSDLVMYGASVYKDIANYGIFGYTRAHPLVREYFTVYRAQSFFGEPTVLASFMEVSFILSLGFYKLQKSQFMKWNAVLSLVCLLLTFSTTGYIVTLLTLLLLLTVFLVKSSKRNFAFVSPIFFLIAIILGAGALFVLLNPLVYSFGLGNSARELTLRAGFLLVSIQMFMAYPLGVGFDKMYMLGKHFATVSAPIIWLVRGGIFAFTMQVIVIFLVLKKGFSRYLFSQNHIGKYVYLSFIALVLHQCLAGDWFGPLFFFLLVSLLVYLPESDAENSVRGIQGVRVA